MWLKGLATTYEHDVCCEPVAAALPPDWRERLLRIAKEMHEGTRKPGDLDNDTIQATYKELNEAANKGRKEAGQRIGVQYGDSVGPDPATMKMQQNLFKFSGAKTYAQLEEMNRILYKNGKVVSFDDFKAEALKINEKYNLNHLQAEFQTSRQAGHHARNWEKYESQKRLFPNLRYRTAGDKRVRPEHQRLDGIVAPIDSPIWDKYYPPNGWRCRCYVVQTAEAATPDNGQDFPEVKQEFRINVGKTGQAFSETSDKGTKPHPYFALAKSAGGKALKRSFEASKLNAPLNPVYKAKNGATVNVSPFADLADLEANFNAATVIADKLSVSVNIRPHLDRTILPGKNPEYEINGNMADRKGVKGYRGIRSAVDAAKEQMATSIVFDLEEFKDWEPDGFYRHLKGKLLSFNKQFVREVFVIDGKKAATFSGDDVVKNAAKVMEALKKLKAD